MDINTNNSSGMMNGMPQAPQSEKKVGPIAGVLIIILVLIIAALYFFGQKLNIDSTPTDTAQTQDSSMTANAGSADDVATLQADLNSQLKDVDYSF